MTHDFEKECTNLGLLLHIKRWKGIFVMLSDNHCSIVKFMSWCLGETSFDSHENNIPKEKSSGGWMRNRVDGGSEKYDYNKRHYEQKLSEFWIIYGDIGGVDT